MFETEREKERKRQGGRERGKEREIETETETETEESQRELQLASLVQNVKTPYLGYHFLSLNTMADCKNHARHVFIEITEQKSSQLE
jgi:hypothetical protein